MTEKSDNVEKDIIAMDAVEKDFGASTLTSKGQIILPSALRQALDLDTGDKLRWRQSVDGSLVVEARKRRSIVDVARQNPIRLGEAGLDLEALIDDPIEEAMDDKVRRGRRSSGR